MICALLIGRSGSKGYKNKNIKKILGKSLCEYSLIAAKKSSFVKKIYVSTDCSKIKKISKKYNCNIINRPKKLCTQSALGEDVFRHGYYEIKDDLEKEGKKLELLVLLFANVATISHKLIDQLKFFS